MARRLFKLGPIEVVVTDDGNLNIQTAGQIQKNGVEVGGGAITEHVFRYNTATGDPVTSVVSLGATNVVPNSEVFIDTNGSVRNKGRGQYTVDYATGIITPNPALGQADRWATMCVAPPSGAILPPLNYKLTLITAGSEIQVTWEDQQGDADFYFIEWTVLADKTFASSAQTSIAGNLETYTIPAASLSPGYYWVRTWAEKGGVPSDKLIEIIQVTS